MTGFVVIYVNIQTQLSRLSVWTGDEDIRRRVCFMRFASYSSKQSYIVELPLKSLFYIMLKSYVA